MAIDDRTVNLSLALPNQNNTLLEDVTRLRSALSDIDSILFGKATPADITAAINALLAGAPSALNTLDELAAALGDDANYAASITTALGNKLDKTTIATAVVLGLVKQGVGVSVDGVTGVLSLNIAGVSTLGGIKVGAGLAIAGDGTLSVSGTGVSNTFTESYITPTAAQTTFTISGGYTPGQIELLKNGVTLYGGGDDYTATNGTTIVINTSSPGYVAMTTSDTLLLRKWMIVGVSGAVTKTGDTMSGALNEAPTVTVASASTTDIANAAANTVTVSGTTAITALGTIAAGASRRVVFSGVLTLTHNATSLILPGAANIATAAGDVAEFVSLGTGSWRCTSYTRASGAALTGGKLNVVPVSGTTQTAVAGNNYSLNNVAATAVTMPTTLVAGDPVTVSPNNGLLTNTVNFGAKTVRYGANTLTGVVTLDLGIPMQLVAVDTSTWIWL